VHPLSTVQEGRRLVCGRHIQERDIRGSGWLRRRYGSLSDELAGFVRGLVQLPHQSRSTYLAIKALTTVLRQDCHRSCPTRSHQYRNERKCTWLSLTALVNWVLLLFVIPDSNVVRKRTHQYTSSHITYFQPQIPNPSSHTRLTSPLFKVMP
jgi:hypothetical protein